METEKILFEATVCLPIRNNKVILAIKTRRIGVGCWNGYGGGVEQGETIRGCAVRELEEESCLKTRVSDLEKVAIIYFHNENNDGTSYVGKVHFFITRNWEGEPVETEEMLTPTFFGIDSLPFDKMMLADKKFFPLIVNGKKIIGRAHYSPFQKELIGEVEIEIVEELPED